MMKLMWVAAMLIVGVLTGCSSQASPPKVNTPNHTGEPVENNPSNSAPRKSSLLHDDDFCVDGISLGTNVTELGQRNRPLSVRRMGGYDYSLRFTDVHVSEDGQRIDTIQSYVQSLCSNQDRLKLDNGTGVARDRVQASFGDPEVKVTDGDEYWFYTDPAKDRVMIFQFKRDREQKADRVQVAQLSTAKRLWYPLLGKDVTPKPLTKDDAAIGPIVIRMDSDSIEGALGESGSEGDKRPYSTLRFRNEAIEVHFDQDVRAVFVSQDAGLVTPRGIHVGSNADEVRAAYGPPRVAHNGYTGGFEGDYWSYESLKDGVGLVFTIRDNKVTHIAALDSAYLYRPTAKE